MIKYNIGEITLTLADSSRERERKRDKDVIVVYVIVELINIPSHVCDDVVIDAV